MRESGVLPHPAQAGTPVTELELSNESFLNEEASRFVKITKCMGAPLQGFYPGL